MYSFQTTTQLLKLCAKQRLSISEIVIRYEMEKTKETRKIIWGKMEKVHQVMREAIEKGIKNPKNSAFHMAGGNAPKIINSLSRHKKMILNPLSLKAMAYAIATGESNSAMGRIVAFPTAGGSGVVPGCVLSMEEEWKLNQEQVIRALFNAAGIGIIIAQGATFSAAAGGCQAEVGAATAMAASAVTEVRGGSPERCANAAALALKNKLGLACDPLGGLVAVPCIKRNALGAVHSFGASDLSMCGVTSFIPFDEVVFAMKNISHIMSHKLKETALGGLAVTKTGLKIRQKIGLRKLKKEEID